MCLVDYEYPWYWRYFQIVSEVFPSWLFYVVRSNQIQRYTSAYMCESDSQTSLCQDPHVIQVRDLGRQYRLLLDSCTHQLSVFAAATATTNWHTTVASRIRQNYRKWWLSSGPPYICTQEPSTLVTWPWNLNLSSSSFPFPPLHLAPGSVGFFFLFISDDCAIL